MVAWLHGLHACVEVFQDAPHLLRGSLARRSVSSRS